MTQKASASENSAIIQVSGNLVNGLSQTDCERLFNLLFSENFPKLDAIARETAERSVSEFVEKTFKKLEEKLDCIDTSRLAEPDVQSTYNTAIQAVAKKGRKIDIDLLGDLLQLRLEKNTSNYIENCVESAVEIVPKLTNEMLVLLPVLHFIQAIEFRKPYFSFVIDNTYGIVFDKYMTQCLNISVPMLKTMGAIGVGNYINMVGSNTFAAFCNKYQLADAERAKSDFPKMYKALQIYDQKNFHQLTLTAPGQIIAIKLLHKIIPDIDIHNAFQN